MSAALESLVIDIAEQMPVVLVQVSTVDVVYPVDIDIDDMLIDDLDDEDFDAPFFSDGVETYRVSAVELRAMSDEEYLEFYERTTGRPYGPIRTKWSGR